ncbi:MAG: hypothetical protein K9N06_11285 [Candidatus Cloacimonetes bacterium]|nr:hypothetical protein [Candidatus Cloacimonadota bacterium]
MSRRYRKKEVSKKSTSPSHENYLTVNPLKKNDETKNGIEESVMKKVLNIFLLLVFNTGLLFSATTHNIVI